MTRKVVRTKPRSAKSITSKQRTASTAPKPDVPAIRARRYNRNTAVKAQEVLPTLLDLKPDENGCLYPGMPDRPGKCSKKVWQDFRALVRRRDVIWLRIHKGLSTTQIDTYLELKPGTAAQDYRERMRTEMDSSIAEMRQLEVQRLDDLIWQLEENVRREIQAGRTADDVDDVSYKALDRLIKLQSQKIRLMGLERQPDEETGAAAGALVEMKGAIKATADATEFIAGVLAASATKPEDIIKHMQELTGVAQPEVLEGEALEEFLHDIDSDIDPSLAEVTESDILAELEASDIVDAEIVPDQKEEDT